MGSPASGSSSISLHSEIGRLRRVIVHEPGQEIENMTPASAAESLYDDILYLPLALVEHRQLTAVLRQTAQVYELADLLVHVLRQVAPRHHLVTRLCELYDCLELVSELIELPADVLARQLIEGTPMRKDTLAKYLSPLRYSLPPLSNAFFMRDATMCVNDRVIIGSMANRGRVAEALVLKTIFTHHPAVRGQGFYYDGTAKEPPNVTVEGGDLLVIRDDLLVIGYSERTSAAGIDVLLEAFARAGQIRDVIVAEIPKSRATIHLDMIFTMVDRDACVIFPPLITGAHRCRAIHVTFDGGRIQSIRDQPGLLEALDRLGVPLTPIACGGDDPMLQEREQWTSGANFLALAPGKIIGYDRSPATFAELERHGFTTVPVADVMAGRAHLEDYQRCAVMIGGAELSRGGGGCRCMTLPTWRDPVDW